MKENFTVRPFYSFRELASFVNTEGIKKENIVEVMQKDSEIVLLYYK